MQTLQQDQAAAVTGGAKFDPVGVPPSTPPTGPVPIWRPVFPIDP